MSRSFGMSEAERGRYSTRCDEVADSFTSIGQAIREDDPLRATGVLSTAMHQGGALIGELKTVLLDNVFSDLTARIMTPAPSDDTAGSES